MPAGSRATIVGDVDFTDDAGFGDDAGFADAGFEDAEALGPDAFGEAPDLDVPGQAWVGFFLPNGPPPRMGRRG